MATIDVKNLDGKTVGDVDLDDSVFGAEVNEHLLWEVVKAQRAKRRAGTASTKRRDEVRGGGKKPYKQKGTGHARQGSTRAPHCVGGGKVFGPKPRDYEYHVPQEGRWRARCARRCRCAPRSRRSSSSTASTLDGARPSSVATALEALGARARRWSSTPRQRERSPQSTRNLPKRQVPRARRAQRLRRARPRDAGPDARDARRGRRRASKARRAEGGAA